MTHRWSRVFTLSAFLVFTGGVGLTTYGVAVAASDTADAQRAQRMTQPYQAEYILTRRGRTHGKAGRTLSKEPDGSWNYQTFTEASLLIFTDRRAHETHFQLVGDRVIPLEFEYTRSGTGAAQSFAVSFDYDHNKLVQQAGDPLEAEWKEGLLDSNAVLHQLQIDVAASVVGSGDEWTYQLIDEHGRNTEYTFRSMGYETIQIAYGVMDTIRVMRVRETNRRETYFWFSPLHNYTLIQMQQLKEGKEQAKLVLRSLERN